MVGGHNYRKSQFNLAVQGERQPGSSFKPFVLASALSRGSRRIHEFESEPVTISLGDKVWYVPNYEDDYLGRIDLDDGDGQLRQHGLRAADAGRRPDGRGRDGEELGVRSPLAELLPIGLGAEAVNPLEMARAYSAFANGGKRIDGAAFGNRPRAIAQIRTTTGRSSTTTGPCAGRC